MEPLNRLTPANRPGVYPDPSGAGTFVYWTGSRVIAAPEYIEEQIIKAVEPHLENAFAEGMKAGIRMAQQATQST